MNPPAAAPAARPGEALPRIFGPNGIKQRRIASVDLGRYRRPVIPGNRSTAWRAAWYLISALFFQGAVLGLIPSAWKAAILRAFGARVGKGLVCKPRVSIKYPWFLELGDHVWLGEGVWIDNHCMVRIGSHVCISQAAYLFTGNHDWNDPTFRFLMAPILVEEGAWIGARAMLGPGTVLCRGEVLAAGQVMTRATFRHHETA